MQGRKNNEKQTKKKGMKGSAEWSSSHTHVWFPSMPPALQSLNQPAGWVLMNWTPVHRPTVTEAATHLAAPCQDLIWDVQVVVKLFYITVSGSFCHASCQMSQAVTQGVRPPVARPSLLSAAAAAAQSHFSDQSLVWCIFYFIPLLIYLFRTTLKAAN